MATPWSLLQYDEDGNPVGLYDASDAGNQDRSPAGMPLMLSRRGRANYSQTSNSVNTASQASPATPQPMPQAPQASQGAPQVPGMSPFAQMGPQGMQDMKKDINWTPGMGNQLQDKNQLTQDQKHDLQHAIFQSPVQSRLLTEQSMGMYPQPLKDEQGNVVKDENGDTVYDPNTTVADPNHPYQRGMQSLNAARELLAQRLKFAPNQTDLSPLMSLADAWSPKGDKSNLEAGYHPHTYDQAAQSAMQYMNSLQQRQDEMDKEAGTSANAMKAGLSNNAMSAQFLQSQMAALGMGRPFNPITASNDWNNQVKSAFQKDDADADNLNQLLKEVSAGNKIDDARISIIRASADAHGRPNMAEVNNEAGSKALVDKAAQSWDFLVHGKLTDDNRNLILQSLHTIANYRQSVRNLQAQRLTNMGTQQYMQQPNQTGATLPASYVKRYDTTTGAAPSAPVQQTQGPSIQIPSYDDYKKAKGGK